MTFVKEIEKLIESNFKTYRDNSDRFVADYNRELELTKEYNGRQILELLQNADDAGSDEVRIEWKKSINQLTISNKGEPFSVGGIKSLMLANLSTKTKVSYIGNKGLGFRSILNWAEIIRINTNGCELSFSEDIANRSFNKLGLSEIEIKNLKEERNLTKEAIPFPILAIPIIKEFTKESSSSWTTSINITYKNEFEKDIQNQLNEIKEEILLFLNKVNKICICINTEERELLRTKIKSDDLEVIQIKNKKWNVFTLENLLPIKYQDKTKSEKQSYNLKVAFQDNLTDDYNKLFNYFPTQLSISLPCIIHGTFELNSSRNHLNESDKNTYILHQLVKLLEKCTIFLTKQNVDWRPIKLISPLVNHSDSKLIEAFYNELEALKERISIYPCISEKYHSLKEVRYYNDKFSNFTKQNFREEFPEVLLPLNGETINLFQGNEYEHKELVARIDMISLTDLSVNIRAELIAQLSEIISYTAEAERFSLLVNEANNVINKDDTAFTPVVRSEENFTIPQSVKVDFMKSELYDLLILKFESKFDRKEPKSRELQRIIKSVVNLQPYDSNNVIDKIITGTKDTLKKIVKNEEKLKCIKEMVAALLDNFKHIENRQEKLKVSIPVVTKKESIVNSSEVFLSKTYPSGELTEIIYSNILLAEDYLVGTSFWGFEDEEQNLVESFFLWLGVNKFSKIETLSLQSNSSEQDYFNFIFDNGTEEPDDFNISRISKETIVFKISNFSQLASIPINKLLLLVLKDSLIRRQLEGNDERIDWYYAKWRPSIISEYSYLRYQFITSGIFSKYVLEEGGEELNKLINEDFEIDYNFLYQYGINKAEIKAILIKLGAKESFNELSPKNIYEIINSIPGKDKLKKGRATQSIYKMALESLVKQEIKYSVPEKLMFYAHKGESGSYVTNTDVYYSDNTILPKKIIYSLYILNLPKRSGEDNVEKYFGIKSLREFKIDIEEAKVKFSQCNSQFSKYFELIKPYILTHRLNKLKADNTKKREEARTLKLCTINIVKDCFYTFGDRTGIQIEEEEFINVKNQFYFKHSRASSIEELKRDSVFCDAFAEMICIIFKVNDLKNDFRQILKNDLSDTMHLVKHDLGEDKLKEAFELLGISRVEIEFWQKIFDLKGKKLLEPIEDFEKLSLRIKEGIALDLPSNYDKIDFEYFSNAESMELVKSIALQLELDVKRIAPIGFFNFHRSKFIDSIKDNEYKFKQILWAKLNLNSKKQKEFISLLNDYNRSFVDTIEANIQILKFEIDVNYSNYSKDWIIKHFDIDITTPIQDEENIVNLHEILLKKYGIEENDISEDNIRSLLYFQNTETAIEEYLKENYPENKNEEENKAQVLTTIAQLVDAALTKGENFVSLNGHSNNKGGWVHSGLSDNGKKQKGKAAEQLVYNTFVKKYSIENVKWVSGNSTTPDKNDKLHYDIEYKNDNGEWKYVEVKSVSGDYFIISYLEKEKGISEPGKYEIALVKDGVIYIVKNLFEFNNGESFDNNSKFTSQPKDYVFTFNINNLI